MSHYGRGASTQVDATTHGPYRQIVGHVEVGHRVAEILECGHRCTQHAVPTAYGNAEKVHAQWLDAIELGIKVARKRRCYACLQVANRD